MLVLPMSFFLFLVYKSPSWTGQLHRGRWQLHGLRELRGARFVCLSVGV